MDYYSFTGNADIAGLEALYEEYRQDPDSVDPQWRQFFEGFDFARQNYDHNGITAVDTAEEVKVLNLINAYRERGHFFTKTNPVRTRRKYSPTLDIENFGLNAADLNKGFAVGKEVGLGTATLASIRDFLEQTYCRSIGVEYMYIRNVDIVSWVRERLEKEKNTPKFSTSIKRQILESITHAVGFEKFVHRKFPGFKSFSLEGGEALIPALEAVIERAADLNYEEFVIGMPHRGRLNVLANILHKPYETIFKEFDGDVFEDPVLLGDVKYHLGFSSDTFTSNGKKIHLTLSPNPSHLEAIDPVVEGLARAMADHSHAGNFDKVLPFLIHGDSAMAGQGVVYETVQMSELAANRCGGTIHFVVNNQVGFTTNYTDARSSIYCTDVAKILQTPVLHVNGDDVEAVVHAALFAMDFRHKFHKDVFIDLLCYRKYGHNESDEPRYTQPLLYKIIEKHPNPMEIYLDQLLGEKLIDRETFDQLISGFNTRLEQSLFAAKQVHSTAISNFLQKKWEHLRSSQKGDFLTSPPTAVGSEKLSKLVETLTWLPPEIPFFRKIKALQEERSKMPANNKIDWAMAELLALGSLLDEGHSVRLCGQDSKRGTFSQRHAVFTAEDVEEEYTPLRSFVKEGQRLGIYNSLLSEYAALGFEFGYAWASPDDLVIWEAQYGDFANGAQILFDQFISSAEEKWNVNSGLVLLLPHGYEGQGPEHSSARMERYLAACANDNLQIAQCSTPANYFHLLRRQLKRPFRKPLIVFTPKSLLRLPACVSGPSEFTSGGFREVITDDKVDSKMVNRVIFCSGKVYYALIEERKRLERHDVALIRIEQLFPFPEQQVLEAASSYPNAHEWLWVQEEPANMGAWTFLLRNFKKLPLLLIARPASGSPTTGSPRLHKLREQKILDKAFGTGCCEKRGEECQMLCARDEENFLKENPHINQ